jgi:hypothetical protein
MYKISLILKEITETYRIDEGKAIDMLFDFVEESFAKEDLMSVLWFIDKYIPTKDYHRLTVNLLRVTSRVKDRIPGWKNLLDIEKELLDNEKKNTKRILRGLI